MCVYVCVCVNSWTWSQIVICVEQIGIPLPDVLQDELQCQSLKRG